MGALGLKKKKDGLGLLGGDNHSGLPSRLPLSTSPKAWPLLAATYCALHPLPRASSYVVRLC